MKKGILKRLPTLIGGILGAIGGYFYWKYVGCASGTCPITSSPLFSTIWGALLGGLLFSLFKSRKSVGQKK